MLFTLTLRKTTSLSQPFGRNAVVYLVTPQPGSVYEEPRAMVPVAEDMNRVSPRSVFEIVGGVPARNDDGHYRIAETGFFTIGRGPQYLRERGFHVKLELI